jgi:O-antigen ligase
LLEYIKEINADVYIHDFVNLKRVFSTFISPNIFASYVVMMLFIGAGLLISAPKLEKIIYGLSLLIMATSLILTKSAGGILAFVLTFILFIFYVISYMLPEQGFKKTAIRKFSTSATFLSFIFLIIFIVFIWNRIPQFLNFKNPNNPIIQRSYYWQASINMIKDFPVLGAGWRKFGSLYEFYKSPLANISHYSHNIFLQIMAEMGPLGLLSFLWIIFIFLKTGLRNIKNNDSQQGLKIGLFCAGCVFLIHNLFDLSFYFGQAAYFWWVILGLFSAADYKNI